MCTFAPGSTERIVALWIGRGVLECGLHDVMPGNHDVAIVVQAAIGAFCAAAAVA